MNSIKMFRQGKNFPPDRRDILTSSLLVMLLGLGFLSPLTPEAQEDHPGVEVNADQMEYDIQKNRVIA